MILDVNRVEKKFQVDPVAVAAIRARLEIFMQPDSHNGVNGYPVRSVYFDSLYDRDYQEKMDGLDDRKKIRLRIYDPKDEFAKLELKEKHNGRQRKQSILLSREEAEAILKGDYSCLNKPGQPLAFRFYSTMMMDIYRPKCMVEYDRLAYVLEDNETRVTFDSNLRASETEFNLFHENPILYPVAPATNITMEVKYDEFLMSNVKKAISHRAGKELSNSKYCRARMIFRKTPMSI